MNWLPIIIVSVQVSLVEAIGLVAGSWLRSAAHRHTVLLAALVCILASPLFYAGAAWFGISLNLPAPFAVPQESTKEDRVLADSTPVQQQNNFTSLPEIAVEVPTTPFPELPTPTGAPPIAPEVVIAERPARASRSPVRADYIVVGLWLVGSLFSCAGVLRSQVRTNRILKAARKVGKDIDTSVIAAAERRLGAFRHLRIATTGKVAGPVVVGFLQPWILIPARYLETLSREELLQVLIHEGAHALRRDPLVALLQRIGGAMFWWHPLVHLVNRNLTRAREEVCDNFVLTHTEPETYGATLLRLATLSPAMARLPMAIGMFDGRGKLEERIRGLLDSKRAILTHVRFTTGAAVLCAFALLSVFVAVTRVVAQNPEAAAPVVAKEAEAVDAKDLDLVLTYHGEADKPFYNLFLHVPPQGALQANPFTLAHRISEDQGAKLLKQLKESEFFEHAKLTENQNDPTAGPQYLLRIRLGEKHYEETLGWDVGTLIRLDALRKTLDGDAAKSLDQLLARLNGQRKVWDSGEVVGDLKTTLSTEKDTYSAGQAIPIKLELTNVGQEDRQYGQHEFIRSGQEIVVTDEHGRQVPYLGGGAGLKQDPTTIKPGDSKVIEDCDLSDFYYLRRPGSYAVAFRTAAVYKAGVPSSNVVRFRVTAAAGPAIDGDPMGKLLPLVSPNFGIIGSPNAKGMVRPGGNHQETAGWQFIFVGPEGLKGSKAAVWLWLTDEAAKEAETEYPPTSEYLGKVSRWHMYLHVPPAALELWPAVKEDLKAALERTTQTTGLTGAASEDDYRLLHDRYKALILTAAKAVNKEEVAKLTEKFNEAIGGKLLFAQVTLRVGPIAEHEPLLSKFFDPQRKISIGKLGFAKSARPIVSPNHDGQGVVLVATNPLGGNKWPDDLQVTLVMDNVAKKEIRKPPAEPKWSEEKDGIRTRITAEKQTFPAGAPIPLKLEIENVGRFLRKYETPMAPHNDNLIVTDEAGRPVPYIAGLSQVAVLGKNLAPGVREEMKVFDLSESYYLRRPGRYSVRWPGGPIFRVEAPREEGRSPETAPFEFDIAPNPDAAADGDPIGRLLPLVREKWWLTATGKPAKVHPGSNREEVPGCFVFFHYNPTGYKPDSGLVFLWLTEKAAAEEPDKTEAPTVSEYLGKVDRWHVYTYIDANGGKAWPTAKDDIKKALDVGPKQADAKPALKAPQWGELTDGFRARLSAGKQTFDAAEPIPLRLEIENSGQVEKEYLVPVIPANQTVRVVDEWGRDVQPLLNIYQITVGASRPENIKAGRSIEIASFDLGESFYLRRPGRYKVSWSGKPASPEFEFEVAPNPARAAADGDPVGRLLPLVKEGWWLGAGPRGKFKPGSNWGETTGQIVRFVKNPPADKGDGFINLCLMDESADAIPVNTNSSASPTEYLGKISRWHVYYLASEIGLKTWPTVKEDIKEALAATPKVSIRIDPERAEFVAGEKVTVPITIRNVGKQDIPAPETYWSARVLLDGKEFPRRAQTPWSGAGSIAPSASYSGSIQLSEHEFGIPSSALTAGEHKLALKVGNHSSNEVLFTILAEKRKVSLKIDADRLTFGPAADVTVMATIGNLGATDLDAPATYWAARVILDGKEYKRLAKFIGDWNGPAFIIPNGTYRGGITLTEYGIDPATLKPGEHKLSLKLGDEKSNELTLHIQDPAQAEALRKKHLAEIAAIKVGGTREALLKVFQPEGGLSTRAQRRYAYRANPNIKVDVTFAAAEMPEDKLKESPRDKVLTISEPILESPISDALTAAAPKRDPKFSIAIAAAKDRVSPSGDVELTITLQNLQKEKVSMPWVYGNTRVLFDGKDIGAMGFMVDRGPAELDSQQTFRTAQTLKLGGQPPGAHKVGLQIGDDVSNTLIVDLGWSETVEHLSARLLVGTKDVVEGAVRLSVELELQLAPKAGEMTGFHLDRKALKFAVVDGKGKAVLQPEMVAYGGPVPGPWTVSLTPGKSRRVDVTAGGLSIRRNLAAVLDLGPYVWEFKRGDAGPYYLQASLEVAKDPGKASAWSGTIQLPKVRIPLPVEGGDGGIDGALGFIKKRYAQIPVKRIDDHTLGVIWESGAREAFEELKQQIKTEFGIDVKITATE